MAKNLSCPVTDPLTQSSRPGCPEKMPGLHANITMQDIMEAIAEAYDNPVDDDFGGDSCAAEKRKEHANLNLIAEEFGMTPLKVRKLLITAGYHYQREIYSTPISRKVNDLYIEGKNIEEIMELTGLSRASVHGYLPYSKTVYKMEEGSAASERIRRYQERNYACERLRTAIHLQEPEVDELLWNTIIQFEGYPFCTSKGLKFSYIIKKRRDGSNSGEMFISRKEKSITKATVMIAFHKALELMDAEGSVSGPKKLGTFGASYLYPVFIRLFLPENRRL